MTLKTQKNPMKRPTKPHKMWRNVEFLKLAFVGKKIYENIGKIILIFTKCTQAKSEAEREEKTLKSLIFRRFCAII